MISGLASKLRVGEDLKYEEMSSAMADMLSGVATDAENVEFLGALAEKGETDEELLGMLDMMREFSVSVDPKTREALIDMCGTGGDRLRTFNISTAASFVVAAAGGRVAKHGNRSSSGASGSADIFEYFGYDLEQGPEETAGILDRHGICFMFAQRFHPAMRHVAPARRLLARRTAFNLLGPLSNPAGVSNQLIGVSSAELLSRLPGLLARRGAQNIMTVFSDDGMDEFSTSAPNRIATLKDGRVVTGTVDPAAVGLHESSLSEITVQTRRQALEAFVGAISGTASRAMVETTALNAAGGLIVAGIADGFGNAVEMALSAIRDGGALRALESFVSDTGEITRLREITDA